MSGSIPDGREQPLAIALAAGRRWKKREPERKDKVAAIEDRRFTDADTPERLAKRMKRLAEWNRAAAPELPAAERREATRAASLRPSDITDRLVERQIGQTRDLLSIEFFEQGLDAAHSVGLIVTDGQGNGTGFLVAADLVLTNQHVLRDSAEAAHSTFDLDFEANRFGPPKSTQSFRLQPERFFLNDVGLDYALCAVAPVSSLGKPLADYGFRPLIGEEGKIAIGECVNVIQHPGGRVKQIVVRDNRLVDLPDDPAMKPFFHYQADTERGSSGSPVFNDQWEIVALHHSGVPKTNAKGQLIDAAGKVIADEADTGRIVWVANEGIRVSHLVRHIRETPLAGEPDALRARTMALWESLGAPAAQIAAAGAPAEAASTPRVPVAPQPSRTVTQRPAPPPATFYSGGGRLELTLPLQVSISLGAPMTSQQAALPAALERIEPDPTDPDYTRRSGYDPDFLGFSAPLPSIVDDTHGPVTTFGTGETVLRYHHYSVVMNARRRLAYLAAVNIDSAAPFQHLREGDDRWFFDPRLPMSLQAGSEFYRANPLDRGHLVRRADAGWGPTAELAKLANDDSFHWTNCSPQHQIFNQSSLASKRGLLLWGNLENAVAQLAQRFGNRLSVFNGPVFADTDRPYRENFFVPSEYWKLILVRDDASNPRALAFRLSQATQIVDLPRERFQPDEVAAYAPFQIAVRDLAALTGLELLPFAAWDPLETALDRRESARGGPAGRRIQSERDLVF